MRNHFLRAAAGNSAGGGGGTPWSVTPSNAAFTGQGPWIALDVDGLTNGLYYGQFLHPNGTSYFVVMGTSKVIRRYDLSTAFEIGTGTYVTGSEQTLATGGTSNFNLKGLYFKPDGTKFFYCEGASVRSYDLSTAWDTSTLNNNQSFSLGQSLTDALVTDIAFKTDGTSFYISTSNYSTDNKVLQYDMTTAWDITTASYVNTYTSSNSGSSYQYYNGISFKSDGTVLYITSRYRIVTHTLSTAWDISTVSATYSSTYSYYQVIDGSGYEKGSGLAWKSDGSYYIFLGGRMSGAWEFTLGTAWQPQSISSSYNANLSKYSKVVSLIKINSSLSGSYAYDISPDGTKLITAKYGTFYQTSISTPWDLRTTSSSVTSNSAGVTTSTNYGVRFGDSGNKVYLLGAVTPRTLFEFDLSTPYDISSGSLSYNSVSLDLTVGGTVSVGNPLGLTFSSDGYNLYTGGSTSGIHQYTMTTAWDLSTASYAGVAPSGLFSLYDAAPKINSDGTQLLMLKTDTMTLETYSFSTPYDITTVSLTASQDLRVKGLTEYPTFYGQVLLKEDDASLMWILPYYGYDGAQIDL